MGIRQFSKVFIYTGYVQKICARSYLGNSKTYQQTLVKRLATGNRNTCDRTTPQYSCVLLWNLFGSIVPRSSCAAGNYCTKCNTREPWLIWYPQVSSVSTACTDGNMYFQQEAWKMNRNLHRNTTRLMTC